MIEMTIGTLEINHQMRCEAKVQYQGEEREHWEAKVPYQKRCESKVQHQGEEHAEYDQLFEV